MKLSTMLSMMTLVLASFTGYGQITLKEKNAPLEKVLTDIEKQTKYVFLYDPDEVKVAPITLDVKNASLQSVLELCFKGQPIDFHVIGNNVLLRKKRLAFPTIQRIKPRIVRPLKTTTMQLKEEQIALQGGTETNHFPEIIGQSAELQQTLRLISRVAPTNSTVLVLGETGTGKELVARAIHNSSSRRSKPMIKVNCATLPANLIESELFGHERGSFTGATDRRIGKFELAQNSTLFLDEIGELPLELQVKLLRALQEREIERVGSGHTLKVDVRIIAATNRDLENEVEEGRFRADLYYRLNIFPIGLPSLRNRRDDIPTLVTHFIQKLSKKTGMKITTVSKSVLDQVMSYDWPGNIRELEHVIERSILLSDDNILRQVFLPVRRSNGLNKPSQPDSIAKTIEENERDHILTVLKYCNGRVAGCAGAARYLGIPPSTLTSKLKRLGIQRGIIG